ncbi:unnamed protein product [Cyclocybe aegerita]|uniref:GH16 domain-containing protein n=1 Tax=Cyclocybe aegerita TaxID=1973307 RepID=A0A8S0WLY4_CYCAE|nr:unnamed protein product [Cyclocybe aegerita]
MGGAGFAVSHQSILKMLKTSITLSLLVPTVVWAQCQTYVVPGTQGGFTQRSFTNFSSGTPSQNALEFLDAHGFYASAYPIDATPISREFTQDNVNFGTGALNLKVNAYSGSGPVIGAEIGTLEQFLYGSVRTVQRSSSVPGVVEGNFFYSEASYNFQAPMIDYAFTESNTQEIDFEILTSTIFTSTQACVPPGIWASNQPSTRATILFPFDPRTAFHEYRIDWFPGVTIFYLDGTQVARFTTDVPNVSGPWLWNVWSSGDVCWSAGPPTADSITQIRSIDIYKGYTQTVSGTVCQI